MVAKIPDGYRRWPSRSTKLSCRRFIKPVPASTWSWSYPPGKSSNVSRVILQNVEGWPSPEVRHSGQGRR